MTRLDDFRSFDDFPVSPRGTPFDLTDFVTTSLGRVPWRGVAREGPPRLPAWAGQIRLRGLAG